MDKVKVIIITHDLPFPPNHGGRVDMWNRIQALSRRGIEIHLITWGICENTDVINKYVKSLYILERNKSPLRLLKVNEPFSVSSCSVGRYKYLEILSYYQKISPDLIFLDGLHGLKLALLLKRDLDIPLIYRSHNVEYEYVKNLFLSEKRSIKNKLKYFIDIVRTFRLEKKLRNISDLVYDISYTDQQKWCSSNYSKYKVLNPYIIFKNDILLQDNTFQCDVLYLGNLYTPNNIFGVSWFISEVVPHLNGLSIAIAGSNPTQEIRELCEKNNIKLIPNPKSAFSLYVGAKVLINPIFHGSGINIKIIEMLSTGKPVVSTPLGVRALPNEIKKFVSVADDPYYFAKEIIRRLDEGIIKNQRQMINQFYGEINIDTLIQDFIKLSKL